MSLTEKPVSPLPCATLVQLYDYRGRVPCLNLPTLLITRLITRLDIPHP